MAISEEHLLPEAAVRTPRSLPPASGLAAQTVLHLLKRAVAGSLRVTLPDGKVLVFGQPGGIDADIQFHRARVFRRLLLGADLAFAESYMGGDWTTSDLTSLLLLLQRNEDSLGHHKMMAGWLRLLLRFQHRLNGNSRRGSRRNIAHHYDLGNAFYEQWLDETMTYSAALFAGPRDQDLAAAQHRKNEAIARMAELKPGSKVLEVGCGWGGFAAHAAKHHGASVKGITLSREQCAYATERIKRLSLSDRVEISLTDYREVPGRYDAVVSIEMFEAVGERYWDRYFQMLKQRLREGGCAVIQTITIADERFEAYRRGTDFIQKHVFPGGLLPSAAEFRRLCKAHGLEIEAERFFGQDYGKTLKLWQEAFQKAWPAIQMQGYDTRFKRMWEYYLSYCEAGFRETIVDVGLFKLRRPG